MDASVKNLLYDRPELYEFLYPEANDETPAKCRRIFERYLKSPPRSILDIGCGTGRDLRSLHRTCPDCVGVDFLPQMIEYAKTRAEDILFQVGDMRSLRLGRAFDVVVSFGSAFLYALADEDITRTLDTYAVHCHPGSLLVLDMRNAVAAYGTGFKARIEGEVSTRQFQARYVAEHTLDRRQQMLYRKRTWTISDGTTAQDYCQYRLFFPREITCRLSEKGFHVLDIFDNMELRKSEFTGSTMYVIALYKG
ncbi:MAG: class I SAM-dependent methyltransferase [Planctomycetes bacterium]|nr:class I SAM-dependent methyltransferase [Planctomycetota bacterium]